MREIGQGNALIDPSSQERLDALGPAASERLAVGICAFGMVDPGREEHQFGRLVPGIVGAVTEKHAGALQFARTAYDGRAHGFGGHVDRWRMG